MLDANPPGAAPSGAQAQSSSRAALPQDQDPPQDPLQDPLLECLLLLARLHGLAAGPDQLCAGLPFAPGAGAPAFTPALFVRAARRIGLSAVIARRRLDSLPAAVLPAVLLLDQGQACLLAGIDGETARLLALPGGAGEMAVEVLARRHSGYVILVTPEPGAGETGADGGWRRELAPLWSVYGEVLAASVMVNLFALCMPLFTMNVYDRVVPNNASATLWALTAGMALVQLFDLGIRLLRAHLLDAAGRRLDMRLSCRALEHLLALSMAARPASTGAFCSRMQEFENVREFLTAATMAALIDLPFAAIFLCAMFWLGGMLGLVALLAILLIVGVGLLLRPALARAVRAAGEVATRRQALLFETLAGLETIRAAGAEGRVQRRWESLVSGAAQRAMRARMLAGALQQGAQTLQQIAYLAVVVLGVLQIADEKLTMGGLIACTILAGRALAPWAQVAGLITRYHQARDALAGFHRMMALPLERPPGQLLMQRAGLSGDIEFRDVGFRYPGGDGAALSGLSFRIAAGERVAIIGRVGSGKSTLGKLIMALYVPDSGAVLIGGANARQIDPAALRRHIGHVPQDVVLFAGSMRDNIAFAAPQADDGMVRRAAELAGVADFADRTPQGLGMEIGEGGGRLSGGQRQAIAIARAELLSPPVLLLDEPSSAMDAQSEARLCERLGKRLEGRTLVLVSHRASLLSLVDRVLVLDGGKLVADGPRDQVLAALAQGRVHAAR